MQADGVFQGGGVKGIALAGALEGFADAKAHPAHFVDEWVQVAGTSAGAIVAAFLACGHTAAETVALIGQTDFSRFEDFGPGGEVLSGAVNLARGHGLARGREFRDWFAAQTDERTFGDVAAAGRTLKLIATDITRREMLLLPDSLPSYRLPGGSEPIDPASLPLADAVRMSMSIPYFFEPVELVHNETGLTSTVVDGGVLSNFPVWIFDVADRDAQRPTFGFRLTGGRSAGGGLAHLLNALGWPLRMGLDIFHTTTEAWDSWWVSHATRVRTVAISAGDVGTTDFHLPASAREWLLQSGRSAADAFLEQWDPAAYVNGHGRHLAGAAA